VKLAPVPVVTTPPQPASTATADPRGGAYFTAERSNYKSFCAGHNSIVQLGSFAEYTVALAVEFLEAHVDNW
jgi:hypothetical protein